jgi:hypothetical protein
MGNAVERGRGAGLAAPDRGRGPGDADGVRVAAALRLADLMTEGAEHVDELAAVTGLSFTQSERGERFDGRYE